MPPELPATGPASSTAGSESRIQLAPEDYWQLRAFSRDLEAIQLEFLSVRSDFEKRLKEATERRDRLFVELGRKYGFPDTAKFRCDDQSSSLITE